MSARDGNGLTAMYGLSGRVALVTGSVRGLGYEIARGLAQAGARVLMNGRDPATLDRAVEELRAHALDVHAVCFDATDPARAAAVLEQHPPVDVLVNNVGHRDRRGLAEITPEALNQLLQVHVVAAYALSRQIATGLIERAAPGAIVNVSSVIGQLGRRGDVGYPVAKAAVEGMTRALAAELGEHRIRVNAVAPGTFATETNAPLAQDPKWQQWLQRRTSLGRWGRPHEIAGAVVFLAGPSAEFITGQTLTVDGGMTTTF
ncbi:SDR family oxidoreductase [Promicromonospora sp. NPDC052451]|uniref:SDR family oxidoreductase n=1 Tax=Promicromonospora sp. NPDC052451 TaxID=3364407 RepID=UPI0037CA8C23